MANKNFLNKIQNMDFSASKKVENIDDLEDEEAPSLLLAEDDSVEIVETKKDPLINKIEKSIEDDFGGTGESINITEVSVGLDLTNIPDISYESEVEAKKLSDEKAKIEKLSKEKAEIEAKMLQKEEDEAKKLANEKAEAEEKAKIEAKRLDEEKYKLEAEAKKLANEKAEAEEKAKIEEKYKLEAEAEINRLQKEEIKKEKQNSIQYNIENEVLRYVCIKTVNFLLESYKSKMYTPEYTSNLLNKYINEEINSSNPLFKELINECIESEVEDPYLKELTSKVLEYIRRTE